MCLDHFFLFFFLKGRQKLARFSAHEFATLVIDILTDAKRRQWGNSCESPKGEVPLHMFFTVVVLTSPLHGCSRAIWSLKHRHCTKHSVDSCYEPLPSVNHNKQLVSFPTSGWWPARTCWICVAACRQQEAQFWFAAFWSCRSCFFRRRGADPAGHRQPPQQRGPGQRPARLRQRGVGRRPGAGGHLRGQRQWREDKGLDWCCQPLWPRLHESGFLWKCTNKIKPPLQQRCLWIYPAQCENKHNVKPLLYFF